MIDPKSLRIGNTVHDINNCPYKIEAMDLLAMVQCQIAETPIEWLKPIPISEQELIRLGFRLEEEAHHKFPCVLDTYDRTKIVERLDRIYKFRESSIEDSAGDMSILVILDPHHPVKLRSISIIGVRETFCCADLQYVHQLQNAYYLLSGELELEYKVENETIKP